MKALNKYMVNRLAEILSAAHEGRRYNSKKKNSSLAY